MVGSGATVSLVTSTDDISNARFREAVNRRLAGRGNPAAGRD